MLESSSLENANLSFLENMENLQFWICCLD